MLMLKSLWQKLSKKSLTDTSSSELFSKELYSTKCSKSTVISLPSIIHQFLSLADIDKMLRHHHYYRRVNGNGYFIFTIPSMKYALKNNLTISTYCEYRLVKDFDDDFRVRVVIYETDNEIRYTFTLNDYKLKNAMDMLIKTIHKNRTYLRTIFLKKFEEI